MEKLVYEYPAGQPAIRRALIGVVSSGDLEVLLEPNAAGTSTVLVSTSVDGFGGVWQAVLNRIFADTGLPAVRLEINDSGATPGVVRMRVEQALEEARLP
ncbi:MAG TPA: malonate decarboxylase subunit delta [Burkholderiaceae bacterium]|nr:malonate decarboxylase subunit delta [Burkholderiaceae bacterium]